MENNFFIAVDELINNFEALFNEADNAWADSRILEDELNVYGELYTDLINMYADFVIKEMSENQFLRSLFDIVKRVERMKNTIYTNSVYANSVWDLLADSYVELVEINFCRKNA